MPECPDCDKPFRGKKCPTCGWEAPSKAGPTSGGPRGHFCICGSTLTEDKKCQETGRYPRMLQARNDDGEWMFSPFRCPFVCPVCRERLDWDGSCVPCHGTKTNRREDWCIPGDRYIRADDGSHWIMDAGPQGMRMATSLDATTTNFTEINIVLAGVGKGGKGPDQQEVVAKAKPTLTLLQGGKPPDPPPGPLPVTEDEW